MSRRHRTSFTPSPSRPTFPSAPPSPPAPPWENSPNNGPSWPFPGSRAPSVREALDMLVREAELPQGPPAPRPGEKAPHEDIGQIVKDFLGAVQGVGESVSTLLDGPVNAVVGINGPHRIIDNGLDLGYGVVRGTIEKVLERGPE